jgi:hypothetical protein
LPEIKIKIEKRRQITRGQLDFNENENSGFSTRNTFDKPLIKNISLIVLF